MCHLWTVYVEKRNSKPQYEETSEDWLLVSLSTQWLYQFRECHGMN
ncbi:hypothetical protein BWQ96_03142 [Gracilariopsis chorda]|uniref:Uncharacterized protein n=1 Tax=Gracilariopsis chorda TaxID=448386 RepID=A0A2V3IYC3_9FLOR|nr:hypothetical protein BWQ96_03142 [Gracilariopsis chorda]|eukprot:PXF47065.1 hypothetical protein BWQ96_03142 [Gracilariopsis chorda]